MKPSAKEIARARSVLRRLGGYRRAEVLTAKRRQEIASLGGKAKVLNSKSNLITDER